MPSLYLRSTADAAALAAEFVLRAARADGFDAAGADRAAMAAGEAVANAAEHGNAYAPDRLVHVAWECAGGQGSLVVTDEGGRLGQDALGDVRLPERHATRGRGLFLMLRLADGVRADRGALCLTFTVRAR